MFEIKAWHYLLLAFATLTWGLYDHIGKQYIYEKWIRSSCMDLRYGPPGTPTYSAGETPTETKETRVCAIIWRTKSIKNIER